MPFTHHSHSGQFCNHAKNTLKEMLDKAVEKKMMVFSMTEHIPRSNHHLYPGELEAGEDERYQAKLFENYVREAMRLRAEWTDAHRNTKADKPFQILIGFESEWIQDDETYNIIKNLQSSYSFDFFVGSVHHVDTIPIDFTKEHYEKAKGGEPEVILYKRYFEAQKRMLLKLEPKIVGHFDLIRLYSDDPDRDWRSTGDPQLWEKILENLTIIKRYGGLLEINSAALRKGLAEPYPRSEICCAFRDMGGEFVLSDDSHGIDQVGTNYHRLPQFLEHIELQHISYLWRKEEAIFVEKMPIKELSRHEFWESRC